MYRRVQEKLVVLGYLSGGLDLTNTDFNSSNTNRGRTPRSSACFACFAFF